MVYFLYYCCYFVAFDVKLFIIPNQQFSNVTVKMCMHYLKHIHMLREMFSYEMQDFFETVKISVCNHLVMEFLSS